MKKDFITIFSLTVIGLLSVCQINAQTDTLYYINSSFETPEDQAKWTSMPSHATITWDYLYGGHNWPISPISGDLNAIFYWSDFGSSYFRTLTSLPLDLSTAEKPELSFWHAQAAYIGQDELSLLFKAGPTAQWDTIAYYPNELTDWTQRIFNIQDIDEKYLCEGFQVGFLGLANGGQGVCLDSVVLKETATIEKFVKSFDYESVDHSLVGSRTIQLPLLRLRIEVIGNNGSSALNTLSFRLNSGDDSYFKPGGFKIFHTVNEIYKTRENGFDSQIGSAVSISGGIVTFTGINQNLELGNNYIWLTADLANDIPHLSEFSFSADANSISVIDTTLPASVINDICNFTVSEALFYDNFDLSAGWSLEPDFEINMPQGLIIGKSKDPGYAYSGSNVLGTDLTDDGAYPYGITEPYHAVSPMIDLHYFDQVKVYMRKWIDFNPLDRASISFSTNNGGTWTTVWQSQIDNPTASTDWEEILFDELADEILSKNDSVRVRFTVLETNTPSVRAGFNIDNFMVTGNYLQNDVGITRIISPYSDCIGFNNDTIKVVVRNYAAEATPADIPIYFGLWGADSTIIQESITGSIAVDDSVVFTFTPLANFPQGDIYDKFFVGLALPGDEDSSNDILIKPLIIPDSYASPSSFDFEYKGGIWTPSEGSTWLCQEPEGSIPALPGSPNAWILSPFGDYRNNDTSWVVSNCFDLTHDKRNIVELDYWLTSEAGADGFALEYTTDDGQSWDLVDYSVYGPAWGWYTSNVSALGNNGWSGISDGWETAKELLPEALNTEVKVKFRILWAADGANNGRGMAFDNFKISPAPPDIGISTIDAPYDACQYANSDEISVWVKNFGFNDLHTNDTIIIGYDFDSEPAIIDTFQLSADLITGDSVQFILSANLDITVAGSYQVEAYTLIEDDPMFYGENNDTLVYSFEIWQNPITGLEDTIQSRQVDTLMIQANIEPGYTYLWDFEGSNTTDSYYDVEEAGTYYLTITESDHGCETFDSTLIELLFNDIGIDSIIWPVSSCELTNSETVQVQIRNIGTDSLIVDDKILLYYEFEGGPPVADSITLTEPLLSGTTIWFSFTSTTEDLSSIGDYDIKAYSDYGGDTIPENDTILRTISVFGYPNLNLGSDTLINGLDYLLEVDPAFDTYLWNDNITNGTRTIDTSGVYWLDIVDVHGCPATDTIDIWFRIRDIQPIELLSPGSSCEREGTDPVSMRFINSGSDTLSALDTVTISYRFEEGARYSEIITNNMMLPGDIYDHDFGNTVDLTALGSYQFEITAVTRNDLRIDNDTLRPLILTDISPEIDLGVDDEAIYKVTELVLDAGYDENYSYLWHNGSTEQTYTVTDITTVEVLVTDNETGCYGGDTAFVYLDILDYTITNVDLDAQSCSGVFEDVDVSIINNGNLPRGGAEITLDFYLDYELLFTEYFENIGTWPAGATRIHTTNNSIGLEETGDVVFEILISSAGDLRLDNDDFLRNLEVIPSPDIDLGGSPQQVEFPHTLDAGSGYASYLWSDGSTESTFTAIGAGTYSVTVTGSNGCRAVRSVYLDDDLFVSSLAEGNIDIDLFPNPTSDYITINVVFDEPGTYILEIFNSQDILLLNRKIQDLEYKEEIYIGNLPPGIYFIRIRDDRMYHVSKMIIQ